MAVRSVACETNNTSSASVVGWVLDVNALDTWKGKSQVPLNINGGGCLVRRLKYVYQYNMDWIHRISSSDIAVRHPHIHSDLHEWQMDSANKWQLVMRVLTYRVRIGIHLQYQNIELLGSMVFRHTIFLACKLGRPQCTLCTTNDMNQWQQRMWPDSVF